MNTMNNRFNNFNFFDPCGHHHFESIDDLFDRFTYARYTNIASEMTPGRKAHLSGGSVEYGTHYTLFLTDGDRYTEIDWWIYNSEDKAKKGFDSELQAFYEQYGKRSPDEYSYCFMSDGMVRLEIDKKINFDMWYQEEPVL